MHVAFTDFGRSFDPADHLLLAALAAHRDVEVVDPEAAEILFFGVFGDRHRSFVGTKVHWTGENRRPPTYMMSMIGWRASRSRQAAAKSAVPTSPVKSE